MCIVRIADKHNIGNKIRGGTHLRFVIRREREGERGGPEGVGLNGKSLDQWQLRSGVARLREISDVGMTQEGKRNKRTRPRKVEERRAGGKSAAEENIWMDCPEEQHRDGRTQEEEVRWK